MNTYFTPGQVASIKGNLLRFDENNEKQGIFFITSDGTEIKVDRMIKNKPSELLFIVPQNISAGKYALCVRAMVPRTKTIRTGRLASLIHVARD